MPNYLYKAKKNPQEIVSGTIQAMTQQEAIGKILQLGFSPLEVMVESDATSRRGLKQIRSRLQSAQFLPENSLAVSTAFVRQLADLQEAEVPLLRALEVMLRQNQSARIKGVLDAMIASVKEGLSLSEAMALHPSFFPALYVQMVRTGESTGHLAVVLQRLSQLTQKQMDIRAHVTSSLTYPLVVLGVGLLTVFVLLTFVLPRLTELFEDFDTALPWPTQFVIGLSDVFSHYGLIILAGCIAFGFYLRQLWQRPVLRMSWDRKVLRLPILGEFIRNVEIGRLARTLGTLLESGVSITQAMESVTAVMDNGAIQTEMKKAGNAVREGTSLAEALMSTGYVTPGELSIIAVGEESGKLHKGLLKLAQMSDQIVDQTAKTFMTLFGPVVLIVIVAIVGFMVIAMLLPIFQMNLIVN